MKQKLSNFALIIILIFLTACSQTTPETTAVPAETVTQTEPDAGTGTDEVARPDGWTEASHSNEADPNYDVVFPQDEVNQLTITIEPDDWAAMQANMLALAGEPGSRSAAPGGFNPGGFNPGDGGTPPEGVEPPAGAQPPQGGPPAEGAGFGGAAGGPGDLIAENPMWVAATIEFEGQTWTQVGVRYKGNSSLLSSWNEGTLKLPFKLDFDQFEDAYPEIGNQRFFGFKQLSLANGFGDETFMHDTITYDLLEEAGLPAAETAHYEIVLDYGEGPVSLGLYTVIEVIDDTVVDRVFGDDDGNIYEGDGTAASLAEGTFDQIADSFQKENNEDEADWSDIETLYTILHDDTRTTDPAAWRDDLEAVFDVDGFLEWLAIGAVIQHWDAYGRMTHNYYLYNNPDTGQLTWISWDHNLVLSGANSPGGQGGPGGGGEISLDKADVGDNWPLIRYLLDDATYYDQYLGYLAETADLFNPETMTAKYETLAELIQPYAAADVGELVFETAVNELISLSQTQADKLATFLNEQHP
ncbi:MAG: CotH kinase family protein [Candidatus Promineifilaceae bacterium]